MVLAKFRDHLVEIKLLKIKILYNSWIFFKEPFLMNKLYCE